MVDEGIPKGVWGRWTAGAEPNTDRLGAVKPDVDASYEPMDATCEFDGDRWEPCDPRRNRALHPYSDVDSVETLEEAVTSLIMLRAPMWLGDAAVTISVLVSLASEAEGRLHDTVANAREQDYSWDQIARHLGTSVSSARRRYVDPVAQRKR
jgi:hypothetical protein